MLSRQNKDDLDDNPARGSIESDKLLSRLQCGILCAASATDERSSGQHTLPFAAVPLRRVRTDQPPVNVQGVCEALHWLNLVHDHIHLRAAWRHRNI